MCVKYQLDCLAFYKDIVTLSRDNDGKQLKTKLEKYIKNEGQRNSINLFKSNEIEDKLKQVQQLTDSMNQKRLSNLLNLDDDIK